MRNYYITIISCLILPTVVTLRASEKHGNTINFNDYIGSDHPIGAYNIKFTLPEEWKLVRPNPSEKSLAKFTPDYTRLTLVLKNNESVKMVVWPRVIPKIVKWSTKGKFHNLVLDNFPSAEKPTFEKRIKTERRIRIYLREGGTYKSDHRKLHATVKKERGLSVCVLIYSEGRANPETYIDSLTEVLFSIKTK